MELDNTTKISGIAVKVYPLRHTPSGLAVLSFVLEHISMQIEAGLPRTVKCRLYCIILDAAPDMEKSLEGCCVKLTGFLSQNAKAQIVLHVKQINFLDRGY